MTTTQTYEISNFKFNKYSLKQSANHNAWVNDSVENIEKVFVIERDPTTGLMRFKVNAWLLKATSSDVPMSAVMIHMFLESSEISFGDKPFLSGYVDDNYRYKYFFVSEWINDGVLKEETITFSQTANNELAFKGSFRINKKNHDNDFYSNDGVDFKTQTSLKYEKYASPTSGRTETTNTTKRFKSYSIRPTEFDRFNPTVAVASIYTDSNIDPSIFKTVKLRTPSVQGEWVKLKFRPKIEDGSNLIGTFVLDEPLYYDYTTNEIRKGYGSNFFYGDLVPYDFWGNYERTISVEQTNGTNYLWKYSKNYRNSILGSHSNISIFRTSSSTVISNYKQYTINQVKMIANRNYSLRHISEVGNAIN